MLKYELPENVVTNILTFLSRLKFDGADNFKEIDALLEIRQCLMNPIKEGKEQMIIDKTPT